MLCTLSGGYRVSHVPLEVERKASKVIWMWMVPHRSTDMPSPATISWSSHKQELITLSTTEAEYIALTHTAKEAIWLHNFIGEVFAPLTSPTTLHCNNQSTIAITTNSNFHAQTKHIDICYHFIQFIIKNGSLKLVYCPMDDMTTDTLMKALPSLKAKHFATSLGLQLTSV